MTEYVEIDDIINHKKLTEKELFNECEKLIDFGKNKNDNLNSFVGNKILYHFQLINLIKCKNNNNISFYDLIDKCKTEHNELYKKHYDLTIKFNRSGTLPNRLFEAYRCGKGAIVFFKSANAIYIYKKYNAKNILDFTMGWGGRLLGAWALGLNYIGIDTNINMKKAYDEMIELLYNYDKLIGRKSPKIKIIWDNCLNVDYSKLHYDLVLTSPPYVNLEKYECMELWKDKNDFYNNFMLPIFKKVYKHLKNKGYFCLNISPKMFIDFNKYNKKLPIEEINLKQNKQNSTDMIYIYNKKLVFKIITQFSK